MLTPDQRTTPVSSLLILLGMAIFAGITNRAAFSSPGAQQQRSPDLKRARDVYKNIQVLKDLPASQLDGAMDFMAASLGVSCSYCHAGAMDSDEKSTKETTRKMIVMTADINKQSFSGFNVVNCYTCHRGHTEPGSIPEPIEQAPKSGTGSTSDTTPLPSLDSVVAKYAKATGGLDTIDKLATLSLVGVQTVYGPGRSPESAPIEIYNKLPGKFLYRADLPAGPELRGFDGNSGWLSRNNDVHRLEAEALTQASRDCDLLKYTRHKDAFSGPRVLGRDKIKDKDVIVVGAQARDGSRVKMYFDATRGFLLRSAAQIKTPFGVLPDVIDFEDYRSVDGLTVPFRIRRSQPPTVVVWDFKQIKINPPIDDSKFAIPGR
jgi:hypothetical protein